MNKVSVSKTARVATGVALTVAAAASQAAIDTATTLASLTEAGTACGVIGAAVLGVVVIVKTFKYIRGAF